MNNDMISLAERCEAATKSDNALDVLVEIALFEPDAFYKSIRANAAGTKVIYHTAGGKEHTCWADDWTIAERRSHTAASLRARALSTVSRGEVIE